jgi:hypothetical protein
MSCDGYVQELVTFLDWQGGLAQSFAMRNRIVPLYNYRFLCLFPLLGLDLSGKWYEVLVILLMMFVVLRWIGEVSSVGFFSVVEVCYLGHRLPGLCSVWCVFSVSCCFFSGQGWKLYGVSCRRCWDLALQGEPSQRAPAFLWRITNIWGF